MKSSLTKVILISYLFFSNQLSVANQAENQQFPYGCRNSSTYVQKIGEWKFRCYTHCSCTGEDNLYLEEDMMEHECLEKVITVKNAIGANTGGNKCHIIINKCIDFKSDTKDKVPYCSKYKGF